MTSKKIMDGNFECQLKENGDPELFPNEEIY